MSSTVQADNGEMIPLDSASMSFDYAGDNVISITVEYAGNTYMQSFTYAGSNVTAISNWVTQ